MQLYHESVIPASLLCRDVCIFVSGDTVAELSKQTKDAIDASDVICPLESIREDPPRHILDQIRRKRVFFKDRCENRMFLVHPQHVAYDMTVFIGTEFNKRVIYFQHFTKDFSFQCFLIFCCRVF